VDLLLLDKARDRYDLDLGIALLDRGRGRNPIHRLHQQVHKHHVGERILCLGPGQGVERGATVRRLADRLYVIEQREIASDPLADHAMIIDYEHPDRVAKLRHTLA